MSGGEIIVGLPLFFFGELGALQNKTFRLLPKE
jgi:hypothetical protein